MSNETLVKLRHLMNTSLISYFINNSPLIINYPALLPTTNYFFSTTERSGDYFYLLLIGIIHRQIYNMHFHQNYSFR